MSDSLPSRIASERCQRARHADSAEWVEWAETRPALFRSEGFFEDLDGDPPLALRAARLHSVVRRPVWSVVLAHALGLRRA
jgi:hypothetical protein